jgi:hypothetical protein
VLGLRFAIIQIGIGKQTQIDNIETDIPSIAQSRCHRVSETHTLSSAGFECDKCGFWRNSSNANAIDRRGNGRSDVGTVPAKVLHRDIITTVSIGDLLGICGGGIVVDERAGSGDIKVWCDIGMCQINAAVDYANPYSTTSCDWIAATIGGIDQRHVPLASPQRFAIRVGKASAIGAVADIHQFFYCGRPGSRLQQYECTY